MAKWFVPLWGERSIRNPPNDVENPSISEADMCCPNCSSSVLSGWVPAYPISPVVESVHRSNSALSEEQKELVTIAISKVQADCSSIDSIINGLQHVSAALSAAKQRRAQFVNDHKRLLSPARSVPQDVWSLIFQLATEDYYDTPNYDSFGPGHPPMLLTEVCASWRNYAIRFTPRLWSTIQISTSYLSDLGTLLTLHTFLARSASAPLTIGLHSDTGPSNEVDILHKKAYELYAVLLLHSHRITRAAFKIPIKYMEEFEGSAPFLSTCFTALQRLDLHLTNDYDEAHELPPTLVNAPMLRDLVIGHHHHQLFQPTSFPWLQLTSADLHLQNVRSFYDLLQWSPLLESLRVALDANYVDFDVTDWRSVQHVRHARLVNLRLVGLKDSSCVLFFKLETPALKVLELSSPSGRIFGHGEGIYLISFLHKLEEFIHLYLDPFGFFDVLVMPNFPRCIAALKICEGIYLESVISLLEELSSDSPRGVRFPSILNLSLTLGIGPVEWDQILVSRLKRSLLNICRQISPNSTPANVPRLESVLLKANVMEDSFEHHVIQQLKEENLNSLEIQLIINKEKRRARKTIYDWLSR